MHKKIRRFADFRSVQKTDCKPADIKYNFKQKTASRDAYCQLRHTDIKRAKNIFKFGQTYFQKKHINSQVGKRENNPEKLVKERIQSTERDENA